MTIQTLSCRRSDQLDGAKLASMKSIRRIVSTCIFLFIEGAGKTSIDAVFARIREEKKMYEKASAYLVR